MEIWTCLTQIFTTRNLAQMMKIKTKLQTIQKGGMSLKEYFSKIQQYVDALAVVDKPTSVEDHILYILSGLGSDFESMVSVISDKTGPQSIHEVMSLLLTRKKIETRISWCLPKGLFLL